MSTPEDRLATLQGEDGVDARLIGRGGKCPTRPVSARECYRLRVALLRGATLQVHTAAARYESSAAHDHATGACDHDVAAPALRYDRTNRPRGCGRWVADDE